MIRKQIALGTPKIFLALLLVGGLGLMRAEADVVTTVGGESLQGKVTFRNGDVLEMVRESGEKVRISLTDLASMDFTSADQPWLIGGTGVLVTNGSFLAGPVAKVDERVVTFDDQPKSLLLTRQNTAALFFQSLRSWDAEALRFGREGVFLRGGDFMGGGLVGLEEGRVIIDSLLLGRRTFSVETEAIAVILQEPVAVAQEGWSLFLEDGSRLRSRDILLTDDGVLLNQSPYHNHLVAKNQLRVIRREKARPLLEMFRARWLALEPERPLAAAALGEDVTAAELAESLVAIGEERSRQEAEWNAAKAEWIRCQQIVSRVKAIASRGASNIGRMQGQVEDKVRRVGQDEAMVLQAVEDISRKMEMVERAKTRFEEIKRDLNAIPREDSVRLRNWELQLRNAERQKQTAERIANQARAVQRRYEARVKSSQRLVDMARERVVKAREQKEKDDRTHREAEENLKSAKVSYDRASADLREVSEEYRRMEFLLRQKGNGEEK